MFITFEGIDGSGKSTCAQRLFEYLNSRGIPVVLTREPGGTTFGEDVRNVVKKYWKDTQRDEQVMLFTASRLHLIRNVIQPALQEGKVVICDRYTDSSRVYQMLYEKNVTPFLVDYSEKMCMPDITFVLDVSVDVARQRIEGREFGKEDLDEDFLMFLEECRREYLNVANLYQDRIKVLDASKSMYGVFLDVLEHLGSYDKAFAVNYGEIGRH